MQVAFENEVYLLDLLNFFQTCDVENVQKRVAKRLFDDENVTSLCRLN